MSKSWTRLTGDKEWTKFWRCCLNRDDPDIDWHWPLCCLYGSSVHSERAGTRKWVDAGFNLGPMALLQRCMLVYNVIQLFPGCTEYKLHFSVSYVKTLCSKSRRSLLDSSPVASVAFNGKMHPQCPACLMEVGGLVRHSQPSLLQLP